MTLLWLDGFEGQDHDLLYEGKTGSPTYASAGTRFGYGQLCKVQSANPSYLAKVIAATTDVYMGAAYYLTDTSGGSGTPARDLITFFGDSGATSHITIAINASLGIDIKRGATVIASSVASVVAAITWFYLEVHVKVSDTVGAVNVRLNGSPSDIVSFSGDTKNAGTATTIDTVRVVSAASVSSQVTHIDDLYICDGLGTVNNGFLGDRRVQTLFPAGAGATTGLTPTGSATNWQNVDEAPASSTDYNGSAVTGTRDTYALGDLVSGTSTVHGVRSCVAAHKSDAGAASMKPALKVGTTTAYDATVALSTSMTEFGAIRESSPDTSAAWTAAEVNGMEFGAEVV